MKKGDIVLITFPFSDLTGSKNRPALVLINSENEVTVCFLTTRLVKQNEFDIFIHPSKQNGLKKESLIRLDKIATLDKKLVIGRLGNLNKFYMSQLNDNLIGLLKLIF